MVFNSMSYLLLLGSIKCLSDIPPQVEPMGCSLFPQQKGEQWVLVAPKLKTARFLTTRWVSIGKVGAQLL